MDVECDLPICIEFGENMWLNSGNEYSERVEALYIPFLCRVDEDAFQDNESIKIVYCEEGSEAELAALKAGIEIQYYDFENRMEYKKGESTIKTVELDILEFYNEIDKSTAELNGLKRILQLIFNDYILVLNGSLEEENDTILDSRKKRINLILYLDKCGIKYIMKNHSYKRCIWK